MNELSKEDFLRSLTKAERVFEIEGIKPFLKYMYEENNAIWVGQLSYSEFLKREKLEEYELMELEVPNSIVYFLHNKNTHKLYTRGNPDMNEIVKAIRREIYWYDNNDHIVYHYFTNNNRRK